MTRNFPVAAMVASLTLAGCGPLTSTSAAPAAEPAAGRVSKGIETADVNRRVEPCDDFYEFANGAWRAMNPIPAGKSRWSRRVIAREANRRQLQNILEEVSVRKDWPAGSVEQLIGDHYAACMDEARIEATGLAPLAALLAQIDGIQNMADVQRVVRRLHDIAVPILFTLTGSLDYHAPANTIANIAAGSFGLPDREYYLQTDARFAEARQKFQQHVARVFKLHGMSDAQAVKAADIVLAFETRLAEVSLDHAAAADAEATDHKMSFDRLRQLAPQFDWATYFDEAKLPRVDVNVAEPRLLAKVNQELQQTPIAHWQTYLAWRLLDSASPSLSKAFADESFNFNEAYLKGAAEKQPRALRCVESTEALLLEPLGRKYVERHFPPEAKAKVQQIARTLVAVLEEEVGKAQWLQPQTRQKALEKLATYNPQLGYPDRWKDYSSVTIRRDAFWANVVAGRRFNVDDNRKRIGKPTERDLWQLGPASPDAYLDLQLNEIVVPAGFLQPPTFDIEATDAVNYGAIGGGLAHDITHSIDALGAQTDALGRPENWWTDHDRDEFQKRGQCLIDQFEGHFIEPGVHHDGKLVLGEAIGDLAGVRIAYLALQRSMASRPVPTVDGFSAEQQFFIAWGQWRGDALTLEAQRKIVKTDTHPVPRFRVIGPLVNLPQFQQAFSCKAGAPMVKPPQQRCTIW
jgi:putative endopeptidase